MFNEEVLDNNQVVTWVHSRVPGNLNASSQVFKCSAHKPIRNICTWELKNLSHTTISTQFNIFVKSKDRKWKIDVLPPHKDYNC